MIMIIIIKLANLITIFSLFCNEIIDECIHDDEMDYYYRLVLLTEI